METRAWSESLCGDSETMYHEVRKESGPQMSYYTIVSECAYMQGKPRK